MGSALIVATTTLAQPVSAGLGEFAGQTDIGSVTPPGTLAYDASAGTYTIAAAGWDLWADADGFHYVWKKMSGDVSLTAGIDFPVKTGQHSPYRKAALMFRQTLDADSVYVDAAQHGSGMAALQFRRSKGAITEDIELSMLNPQRLRLEKRGDTITMFASLRGEPMHQVGSSIKLALGAEFYVGLGVSGHDTKAAETAVFSHVELGVPAVVSAKPVLYSSLETIRIDDEHRQATVAYTARGQFEAPNWSKDGSTLIFDQDGAMMTVAAKGGEPAKLDVGAAEHCNGSHGSSPDGKWLAITCSTPGKPEARVYIVPASGGTPRLVTANANSYFHSWSPDGKTILFVRPANGSLNIYAIAAEGGLERALTSGSGASDDPDFSPDGRYIYFCSDRGGSMQIWRMGADGSAAEQVTFDDQVNWTPHVSPDGKWMVFLSYEKGTTGHPANKDVELRLMALEDKKVKVIANLMGGAGTINVPSWAPDSDHFAFVSYQMLAEEGK